LNRGDDGRVGFGGHGCFGWWKGYTG
jgi:hypothetical protein